MWSVVVVATLRDVHVHNMLCLKRASGKLRGAVTVARHVVQCHIFILRVLGSQIRSCAQVNFGRAHCPVEHFLCRQSKTMKFGWGVVVGLAVIVLRSRSLS